MRPRDTRSAIATTFGQRTACRSACSSCRWKLVGARDISASRDVPRGFAIVVACRKQKFRNAHMKGVTLALRLALGLPYKDRNGKPLVDHDSEWVTFTDGKGAHLFECFAMTNLLLCSAVLKDGSQKSLATHRSCARTVPHHLVETIGILKPTLVISQGWGLVDTLQDELRQCTPDQTEHRNVHPRGLRPGRQPVRLGGAVSPDTILEHHQSALFPGDCRSRYHSGTQAGAETRADGLSSTAPTVIGAASDDRTAIDPGRSARDRRRS